MAKNRRFNMDLPEMNDPEGVLTYLIVIVLVAGLVFLVLFASGIWTA
jgi:Mg2+ and Co2+ transporter CorA